MKSFKNECEALRHECSLLSKDVAAAIQSRAHWRAKARAARSDNEALISENVRLVAAIAAMGKDLAEARADESGDRELEMLKDDNNKLANALQIVAAELDRLLSGGLKLHKNEVRRIRDMIPLPAQKVEETP